MTARTATVRLYVALTTFVAAVLSLAGALIRLVASSATWLAAQVDANRPARAVVAPACPAVTSTPVLRLVPPAPAAGAPAAAERLTAALTGLGFRAPNVRRFVASLGPRVDREPIQGLIKEGLRALSPAAVAS